jgi:hypothetical protein
MPNKAGTVSDDKVKLAHPESTIDSANRRSFIKKAAIATATVGVASVSLQRSFLPFSSASSTPSNSCKTKQPVTTDTPCTNSVGSLAVFNGSTDISGSWKKPAHLKGCSRAALFTVTNDYRCFCCCCQPYPTGISGRGASVGVCGFSCYGVGVSGTSRGTESGVIGVSCKGPGVSGNSLSDNPGVYGVSLCGPGVSAFSYKNLALCAETSVPTIAKFANDGQSFKNNSAEIQFQSGCYRPISWYEGVGGTGNPNGLTQGQFFIQNCQPRFVLNTCGKIGIGTATPNATLQVNGGLSVGTKIVNSAYSMLDSDFVVLVNASTNPTNVTLPAASNTGQVVLIKKIDNSTNTVEVQAQGSDEIEGVSSLALSSRYNSISLVAGGNGSWYILAQAT